MTLSIILLFMRSHCPMHYSPVSMHLDKSVIVLRGRDPLTAQVVVILNKSEPNGVLLAF